MLIGLVTFIDTNTHTSKGGVSIVWRTYEEKRKTLIWLLLRIAEDTLFSFQSVKFSKKIGLWST